MTIRRVQKSALLVAGILLAIAWAGTAAAQERVEEKVNVVATGEVTALDAAARKITVKSTNDDGVVYTVDAAATIMRGGSDVALEDLQVGWSVVVNGHDDGSTKLLTMIKVVKAP